jgi:hypothetical protein
MNNLFDYAEGMKQRDKGMELAALNRAEILQKAKEIAVEIALRHPEKLCNIDMVRSLMDHRELGDLGMAAGSVFKGKHWEFAGTMKTRRISSHGRNISIWKLK